MPRSPDGDEGGSSFPTTQWTLLLDPLRLPGLGHDSALESLCKGYWKPLHLFVIRRGFSHHVAEELVQDFLIRLLAKNSFAGVDRQHGRFRSFLLACLKNFLSQTREHNCAIKRGGGQLPVSLDAGEVPEPGVAGWDDLDFDRSWAESTLAQATDALRQEYIRAGKDKQFEDLKPFILGGQCDLSRSDLARKEGVELGTIDVAVHRLRRRYGVILRAKVRQAVSSESDVEMEIIYLMRALAEKSP